MSTSPPRPVLDNAPEGLDPHLAWAVHELLEGRTLQLWRPGSVRKWDDIEQGRDGIMHVLSLHNTHTYRVKADNIVRYCGVLKDGDIGPARKGPTAAVEACFSYEMRADRVVKVLRIELDPDDLEVINARTEDVSYAAHAATEEKP